MDKRKINENFVFGRPKVMRHNDDDDDDRLARAEKDAGVSLNLFENFFSLNHPNQIVNFTIPSAAAEQNYQQYDDVEMKPDTKTIKIVDTNYANDAKQKEKQMFLNQIQNVPLNYESSDPLAYENVSTVNVQELRHSDETDNLYCRNVRHVRPKLPIVAHEENIVTAIRTNKVVIIEGATGCGKTTQVPQFICDDSVRNNIPFNIIITQPRRIAAMSVARRVAAERGWILGQHVGYQIGMDRTCIGENTRILYVTTGVLLQKLIKEKRIDKYSHIIIDEVHERTEETDILLMIVKRFMASTGFAVKLILMSATFDVTRLQQYYSIPITADDVILPSVFSVVEKPAEIRVFYLEQFEQLCHGSGTLEKIAIPELSEREHPYIPKNLYELCARLIIYLEHVEGKRGGRSRGSVLVFLPGYQEIQEMRSRLYAHNPGKHNWQILPLHSSITIEEQNAVFVAPKSTERKVILATNIAESSVTVPDIEYVIDFCLTKSLVCDPETHFPLLQLEWASRANCEQRAGRTGRVRDGRCYRMIRSAFYNTSLLEYGLPEIVRSPLELSVLRVKLLSTFGSPKELLGLTIDPPNLSDIHTAVLTLKQVGALTVMMNKNNGDTYYDDEDGDLTTIGHVMSKLPIDVRLSKLIIMGHVFDVLSDCIIIAACLSTRGMFRRPFTAEMKAYISRMAWSDRTFSDSIAYLNAYKTYERIRETGHFNNALGEWCKQHFIQHKRIKEIDALIVELTSRLKHESIEVVQRPNLRRKNEELILKVVMCAAFYPNYFIRAEIDRENVSRMLSQKDPYNSVRIDGFPQNQGIIYAGKLREIFSQCSEALNMDFEDTKAYITFCDSDRDPLTEQQSRQRQSINNDGTILIRETVIKTAVYLAVAMRRWTRQPDSTDWNVLNAFQSEMVRDKLDRIQRVKTEGKQKWGILSSSRISVPMIVERVKIPPFPVPPMNMSQMEIRVTHMHDAGHFWAQHVSPETEEFLDELSMAINYAQNTVRCDHNTIHLGDVIIVRRIDDQREYARAKITRIDRCPGTKQVSRVTVFFIDTGDSMDVDRVEELLEINERIDTKLITIPAQAFQCQLSGVKPSSVRYFDNSWGDDANHIFRQFCTEKSVNAVIYSVVSGIVRCQLYDTEVTITPSTASLNDVLIVEGYAEIWNETQHSKLDHEQRKRAQREKPSAATITLTDESDIIYKREDVFEMAIESFVESEKNRNFYSHEKIRLKGPFSPLECTFSGITRQTSSRHVHIERDSVNAVVLEPNYLTRHRRMLIAGSVGLSQSAGNVLARDTTLMPNIRGFPALVTLLFCPKAEYRINAKGDRYTGAVCGIGYDHVTGKSYDPDNDVELTFDSEITRSDVIKINLIRYHMSDVMKQGFREFGTTEIGYKQKRLRQLILELLRKYRRFEENSPKGFKWGKVPQDLHAESDPTSDNLLFPIHNPLKVHDYDFFTEINDNLTKLNALYEEYKSDSTKKSVSSMCVLCERKFHTAFDLSSHLSSELHLENVTAFTKELSAQRRQNQIQEEEMNDETQW